MPQETSVRIVQPTTVYYEIVCNLFLLLVCLGKQSIQKIIYFVRHGQSAMNESGNVIGTYLHGAFEDPRVLSELLGRPVSDAPSKDAAYDGLANWFASNANLQLFEERFL